MATRERPKMWFNSKGQKTHLFNGVCSAPNCPNGPATGCVDCKCESRGMHCRFPASSPPSLLHPPPLGSCLPGYAYSPWPSCGRCELGLHASAAARRVGSATCCMGGYVCQFMCATMRAIHARLSQRRVCECAGGGQPPLGSANQAAPPAASPSALWEEARAAAEAPPPTRAAAATTATADRRRPALTSSAIPFAPDALLSSEAEPRPAAESACRETFLCLT